MCVYISAEVYIFAVKATRAAYETVIVSGKIYPSAWNFKRSEAYFLCGIQRRMIGRDQAAVKRERSALCITLCGMNNGKRTFNAEGSYLRGKLLFICYNRFVGYV